MVKASLAKMLCLLFTGEVGSLSGQFGTRRVWLSWTAAMLHVFVVLPGSLCLLTRF